MGRRNRDVHCKRVFKLFIDILCVMSKRTNLDPDQKCVADEGSDDDDEISYSSNAKQRKHNQVSVDLKIERVKNAHGTNSTVSLWFDFDIDFRIVGTSSRQIIFELGNETDVENAASTSGITSKEKTLTTTTADSKRR